MCEFRIGQRVRIVAVTRPDNARRKGTQDVVTDAYGVLNFVNGHTDKGYRLAGDSPATKRGNPGWRAWAAYQLEPVIPEGAAPSELSYTELMDRLKAGEVECV